MKVMSVYKFVKEHDLVKAKQCLGLWPFTEGSVDWKELNQAIADYAAFNEAKSKMFGATVSDKVVFEYFSEIKTDFLSEKGVLLVQAIQRIEAGERV